MRRYAPVRAAAPSRSRVARLLDRRWWPLLGVVLVLVLVAAAGGFRSAPAAGVRGFPVGTEIVLQRWVLVVRAAELIDTSRYDTAQPPTIEVQLSATWTGEQSTYGLASSLVGVVVPGGPPTSTDPTTPRVEGYTSGFDPDVPRPLLMEFVWPADATKDTPRRRAPATIDVVIKDERPAQNFLFANEWTTTAPLGHVRLPLLDRRTR